ncbi:NTP transferase domain-containing protein [Candidatus Microgenomates bacterium]|nr:NTP transferase domain-containing protein [Candidatus Microgenomates bacterium]
MQDLAGIVLAAGFGKRMQSPFPKVLHKVAGKPLIAYPIKLLHSLKLKPIVVVIGYKAELVRRTVEKMDKGIIFAHQMEQLGTGDAVRHALPPITTNNCVVINGDDSTFYSPETIQKVLDTHLASGADMTFVTLEVFDPTGFGRIVRDENGNFSRIVEDKVAGSEEKKIKEINDGCYVFKTQWLAQNIGKIPKSPVGEYYLTSLVEIGMNEDAKIQTFKLSDSSEWFGIDTKERLKKARQKMK